MAVDPEIPDSNESMDAAAALNLVIDTSAEMAVLTARRARQVYVLHRAELDRATLNGRELTSVVERGIRLELATALRVTENSADRLLGFAEAVVERYPVVLGSLEAARITASHAEILVEGVDGVEPDFRERVLSAGLALAEAEPVGVFRRKLKQLIEQFRSATLAERHASALLERRIYVETVGDGMAWLHALVPAVEAVAIFGRVTQIGKILVAAEADAGADDVRTLDQARADVLCDLLIDGQVSSHPESARGIRAIVTVTVPALALLEENDRTRDAAGLPPACVEGMGPIPLDRAKELCGGDASWMRVLTHPETGMVLSVGRDQYRPPPSLRKLVRWRADRCMAPGCSVPAGRCEIDHTVAWEQGGSTSLENLNPLCKGHHRVKHHGGWSVTALAGSGGALHWQSPTGRHYVVQPERRVPMFKPSDDTVAPF